MSSLALFSLLLLLSSLHSLHTINGHISLPSPPTSLLRITLQSNQTYTTYRLEDGTFALSLPPSLYLLTVQSMEYVFDEYRVEVRDRDITYLYKYNRVESLVIKPISYSTYVAVKEGVNIVGLIMSPMGLMVIFGAFFMIVMPKMIASLDPEELAELKKSQANMNPLSMMNNLKEQLNTIESESTTIKKKK